MKGYEATMKKEIAREFAHGVMGAACRIKLKKRTFSYTWNYIKKYIWRNLQNP